MGREPARLLGARAVLLQAQSCGLLVPGGHRQLTVGLELTVACRPRDSSRGKGAGPDRHFLLCAPQAGPVPLLKHEVSPHPSAQAEGVVGAAGPLGTSLGMEVTGCALSTQETVPSTENNAHDRISYHTQLGLIQISNDRIFHSTERCPLMKRSE